MVPTCMYTNNYTLSLSYSIIITSSPGAAMRRRTLRSRTGATFSLSSTSESMTMTSEWSMLVDVWDVSRAVGPRELCLAACSAASSSRKNASSISKSSPNSDPSFPADACISSLRRLLGRGVLCTGDRRMFPRWEDETAVEVEVEKYGETSVAEVDKLDVAGILRLEGGSNSSCRICWGG